MEAAACLHIGVDKRGLGTGGSRVQMRSLHQRGKYGATRGQVWGDLNGGRGAVTPDLP